MLIRKRRVRNGTVVSVATEERVVSRSTRWAGTGDGADHDRPRSRAATVIELAVLLAGLAVVVAGATLVRGGQALTSDAQLLRELGAGSATGTPAELKAAAATRLDAALASDGGITFGITQQSTITARAGGPRIPVPHPIDRHKTIELADQYPFTSLAEFGFATRDGFYAAIRRGPAPGALADPDAPLLMEALVRGNETFRNDGDGWYPTGEPPGIGLDPRTVRLLPALLRNAGNARDAGTLPGTAGELRALEATGRLADAPGIIAVDGESFTTLRGPVVLGFDEAGRLASLRVTALNTNMEEWDLVVVTDVVLRYGDAPALPAPEPALAGDKPEVQP